MSGTSAMDASVSDAGASGGSNVLPVAILPGTGKHGISVRMGGTGTETTSKPAPPDFEAFQGTLATQEYIQALIQYDSNAIDRLITPPAGHSVSSWQYESLRQMLLELNDFVARMGTQCNKSTCPKMQATESWVFLCAAHGGKQPKDCCALDYCLHTLVGFAATLTNNELFPTRYNISPKAAKEFGNIARRLYRVFAHAYYHHRTLFDQIEAQQHLTKRFIQFSLKFELMTPQQLIPPIDL